MTKKLLALALFVLLQLPIALYVSAGDDALSQAQREVVFWLLSVFIIAYVYAFEHRPLSSIGLSRPAWRDLLIGAGTGVLTVAGMAVIYLYILPSATQADAGSISEVQSYPLWLQMELCLRAGVFEELLYRGFGIERLAELLRSRWLGALICLTVFTWRHLETWGWLHLVIAGFGGVMLTALYLWRRSLVCNMIAHFITDAVGFLIA
jgi:membrane protease YdiL (CAAX protease family)